MQLIVREARIDWEGSVARGDGTATALSSGTFTALPFSLPSRIGTVHGKTSPEELLAAAHGACFAMSLANELGEAGTPAARVAVRCTITMDEVEGQGHQIVHSAIDAEATAPDATPETFAEALAKADAGCPFSTLIKASATVEVEGRLA